MQFIIICLLLLILVCSSSVHALTEHEAKHLALRTSFASSNPLMNKLKPLDRKRAVSLLVEQSYDNHIVPPYFVLQPKPVVELKRLSVDKRKLYQKQQRIQVQKLRAWWIERMIKTRSPLHEQMILFWHNHFTTSVLKVKDPVLIYRQREILEKHALGYFDLLLRDMMRDPAMLLYLDNQKNRKNTPNENLARELLELFTLGEGNFSERDVKEVARSLTGWGVKQWKRSFNNDPQEHDIGSKDILGVSGRFAMPDVLSILLSIDGTSEFIVKKLWRNFISPEPDPQRVQFLARKFKQSQYSISNLMKLLLMEDAFWDQKNRGRLIKSPIDLLVGLYRGFEVTSVPYELLAQQSARLGLNLFAPPNVKGWPIASVEWINTETLLKRQNVVMHLIRMKEMPQAGSDMDNNGFKNSLFREAKKWLTKADLSSDSSSARLLAIKPVTNQDSIWPKQRLENLLNDPVYQLK